MTKTAEEYFQEAHKKIDVREINEGIDLLKKAIDLDSSYTKGLYELALWFSIKSFDGTRNNINAAINCLKDYVTYVTNDANAFNLLGLLCFKINSQPNELEEYYSKAIELQPNNPAYYFNRGLYYDSIRDNDSAINDFKTSLNFLSEADSISPNDFFPYWDRNDRDTPNKETIESLIYYNLGLIYYRLNRLHDATEVLENAVRYQFDQNYYGYQMLAKLYRQTNNYEKMVQNANILLELAPNNPSNYLERGIAYYRLKKYKNAKQDIIKCIDEIQIQGRHYGTANVEKDAETWLELINDEIKIHQKEQELSETKKLINAFEERKENLKKIKENYLAGTIALYSFAFMIVVLFFTDYAFNQMKEMDWDDWGRNLINRLILFTPLTILAVFCQKQFSKAQKLEELYAYKAIIAGSLRDAISYINDQDDAREFTVGEGGTELKSKYFDFLVTSMNRLLDAPPEIMEIKEDSPTLEKLLMEATKDKKLSEVLDAIVQLLPKK